MLLFSRVFVAWLFCWKHLAKVEVVVGEDRTCWVKKYFLKYKNRKKYVFLYRFFTNPSPCWSEVLVFGENCVKDKKNHQSGVVGDDSLGAGELSIIYNIEPGGKEKDSWNAIKHGLEQ